MALSLPTMVTRMRRAAALPVLMKEMRSQMRGKRAPVVLFATTALIIFIGLLIIAPQWEELVGDPRSVNMEMTEIGRSLFIGLMAVQAILCALIAPSLTSGAIAMERERQTLEMLLLTRLSSFNIAFGKLISALSFVLIILLCGLPVTALSFMFGGVDPGRFAWALGIILAAVLFFGTFGLYSSTLVPKTSTAGSLAVVGSIGWLFLPIGVAAGLVACLDSLRTANEKGLYLGCFIVLTLVLTTLPTLVVTTLISLLRRKAPTAVLFCSLWALIGVGSIVTLLAAPDVWVTLFQQINDDWLFLGNAGWAMINILGMHESTISPIAPYTLLVLLGGTAMFLALTVWKLDSLRRAK